MSDKVLMVFFVCAAIIISVALTTLSLESQTAADNGLQECVITSSKGSTFTVWQKECQK